MIESLKSIGGGSGGSASEAIAEDPFLAFIRATCCSGNGKKAGDNNDVGLFDLEAQFEAMTLHTSPKQVS